MPGHQQLSSQGPAPFQNHAHRSKLSLPGPAWPTRPGLGLVQGQGQGQGQGLGLGLSARMCFIGVGTVPSKGK